MNQQPRLVGICHVWLKSVRFLGDLMGDKHPIKPGTIGDLEVYELSTDGRVIDANFHPGGVGKGYGNVKWPKWEYVTPDASSSFVSFICTHCGFECQNPSHAGAHANCGIGEKRGDAAHSIPNCISNAKRTPSEMQWMVLEKPVAIDELARSRPTWFTAGAVVKLEDGQVSLVGDMNTSGGLCDDCQERRDVVAYATLEFSAEHDFELFGAWLAKEDIRRVLSEKGWQINGEWDTENGSEFFRRFEGLSKDAFDGGLKRAAAAYKAEIDARIADGSIPPTNVRPCRAR